ncbi:NADH-quinone oxidoreductase subunit C [Aestuariivirga litoralis]|uniref:NADH-quinone oxidoreductase subunit C n=1 Tax=Aestuariivirga litoralis TaxID=2650924 RepID=UPI0018C764F3|nr:NADH-quinone oxidoreductase subunit C [Aestuariivirga litoralis]MBG1231847.1 NADH-quinone oxidoreductase subunit C [Aestuariivirga litoralis]
MTVDLSALGSAIQAKLGDAITGSVIAFDELTVHAEPSRILEVLSVLKSDGDFRFVSFVDICGADYPEREKRFDVVYHLLSPTTNARVRIKVAVDESTDVPSAVEVFPAADWFEREVFDLYGVAFTDHPDLRRILTDYGFSGHPLRKDFPVTGHVEVRYDDEKKRVVYEPVKLVQEMRQFDYLSPWEGTEYILPGDEKAKQ